jgi:hypothetical protein
MAEIISGLLKAFSSSGLRFVPASRLARAATDYAALTA